MTGVFYLPQSRALTLKFLQPPAGQWASAYLFVDRQQVLGGPLNEQTLRNTGRIELAKGIHHLEILARDYLRQSKFVVGYETDDGTFEPLPRAWFSAKDCPEIAAFLKPKATLKIEGDALVATLLDQPQRLRKMRLVFNDFVGTGVTVKNVTLKNEQGKVIVPVAEDFSSGKKSQVLQIAPGDRIQVSYEDTPRDRRAEVPGRRPERGLLQRLDHAGIRGDHRPSRAAAASTCTIPRGGAGAGDQLMVIVDDHDADISDDRDTVDVKVATSSGEKLSHQGAGNRSPRAIPRWTTTPASSWPRSRSATERGRTRSRSCRGTRSRSPTSIRENTDPGVPVERTCAVMEAGGGAAKCLVYRTSVQQVEDTSNQALARKSRIKARLGWAPPILTDQVVARHPQYQPQGAAAAIAAPKERGTRRRRPGRAAVV